MNKQRLLNVVRALRESPNPEKFTMDFFHSCGTPCCAFGHYAARRDLQDDFLIDPNCYLPLVSRNLTVAGCRDIAGHFDINQFEYLCLFGTCGCECAATISEAADYIEAFVAAKGSSS